LNQLSPAPATPYFFNGIAPNQTSNRLNDDPHETVLAGDYQALADGEMLVGHVGEEQVLLARRDGEIFAIGAKCTHY
jgi:hypothetical protein